MRMRENQLIFSFKYVEKVDLQQICVFSTVLKGSPAIGPIQSLPFNDDHPDTKEENDGKCHNLLLQRRCMF